MNNLAIMETGEGCQSCAITTPDFIVRAWLEGDEPQELGGTLEAVSLRAETALGERDRLAFIFHGSRAQMVCVLRTLPPDMVVADPRFTLDDTPQIETQDALIAARPVSRKFVEGTIEIPFGFVGDFADLTVLAWGSSLRQLLNDPRFAIGERSPVVDARRRGDELAALRPVA